MKRIVKDYFTFSKKERTAIFILLLLMAVFVALPYFYPDKNHPPSINKALVDFVAQAKQLSADSFVYEENSRSNFSDESRYGTTVIKETFPFDPNTIGDDAWRRLGISDKTIRTINNYRNKGGQFRQPEDLRKIWGIRKEDADRLVPYVRVERETDNRDPKTSYSKTFTTKGVPKNIDINIASEEDWALLPGIGEVLAKRIVAFREKAGGFTSAAHVKKTYGISDSVFNAIEKYLTTDARYLPKVNLNTASVYQLKDRLGIEEPVARSMVVFRKQYGPYQSVQELKKLVFLPDSVFQRIISLVSVE